MAHLAAKGRTAMQQVSADEAKERLAELIEAAVKGSPATTSRLCGSCRSLSRSLMRSAAGRQAAPRASSS